MAPAKVSLHVDSTSGSPTPWRLAFTEQHMKSPQPLRPVDRDRAVVKFAAPAWVDGVRRAFVLAVPRAAFRYMSEDPRETVVDAPDRWDVMALASIVMAKPGVEPAGGMSLSSNPLRLENGCTVWLFRDLQKVAPCEPEPPPDGNLLKLLLPESNNRYLSWMDDRRGSSAVSGQTETGTSFGRQVPREGEYHRLALGVEGSRAVPKARWPVAAKALVL